MTIFKTVFMLHTNHLNLGMCFEMTIFYPKQLYLDIFDFRYTKINRNFIGKGLYRKI